MKIKFILPFIFLISFIYVPCGSFAQNASGLAPELASKFPASVIVKLYEVTSRFPLPADRQVQLAQHFAKEDSLVAMSLLKGAPAEETEAIRSRCRLDLARLFSPRELMEYYNKVVYEHAALEARITADMQVRKYGADSILQKALYNHYYAREQQVQRTYQLYAGTPQMNRQLASVIARYDSLENKLLHSTRSSQYFRNRLAVLDSIRPLTQKETSTLRNWYQYAVSKSSEKSFADNFTEALRRTLKDTLYYAALYGEEIAYQAKYNAGKTLYDLARKTQLTAEGTAAVRPLVAAKERAIALIQYTFPVYSRYKDSLNTLAVNYYDSLIGIELMKDGYFPDASQFSLAIKNRRRLELRPGQVDSLYGKALVLQRMRKDFEGKKPSGKFDPSPFEAEHIQPLLSEEQYLQLLTLVSRPQAELVAINDYTELVQRKLFESTDSMMVVSQLTAFYSNRELVKQRYTNDKVKQYKHLLAIENNAPPALRRLREARMADSEAANRDNQGVRAAFQW